VLRLFALLILVAAPALAQTDPLPSWRDGEAKAAIVDFVAAVTDPEGADFVPDAERVAVFDNDGTLWVEQPIYTQFAFALDRVKALAPDNPDWAGTQPFAAVLGGDAEALAAAGTKGLGEIIAATHAGMSTAAFETIVTDWLATARHPRFDRPYEALVYQPMLEVMAYLRANGFETYIVSGGGIEFMRPWTERVYGVPPQNVVGSSIRTEFRVDGGVPVLMRLPELAFVDDGPGKPVGINAHIGRRPIAAFGNSDGDFEMLQWTTQGVEGRRLGMIVHHTDGVREYAYDRDARVGRLDRALDAAPERGWVVIDMAKDWAEVFGAPR
jgi:hypothetical protein